MEESLKQVQDNKVVERTYKVGGDESYSEPNWQQKSTPKLRTITEEVASQKLQNRELESM